METETNLPKLPSGKITGGKVLRFVCGAALFVGMVVLANMADRRIQAYYEKKKAVSAASD